MNLRHLEVFRAVMLTGGIKGAAELLHVSEPAVSKMLAHAASRSGIVLFERVKGRLVPTPEAQQLYAEVESLWRGVEKLHDVTRSLAHPQTGSLHLAVSASLAPHLVPLTVEALYALYPDLKCRIEVLIPTILVDALLDRSAHLGVGLLPNPHPNLATVAEYRCGLMCVMREDHPLAALAEIRPRDLVGHRVIGSPDNGLYGQSLERAYGRYKARLRLDLEVRSATTACWFAQTGVGVAVVDNAAVARDGLQGLTVRPFQSAQRLDVKILRNRYRPMSRIQQTFCRIFDDVWQREMPRIAPPRPSRSRRPTS